MVVAIAQINTIIGDFESNAAKILAYAEQAAQKGAELVVFPEMCLCGYPPLDLLDYDPFVDENLKQVRRVQHDAPPELGIVLGYIDRNRTRSGKALRNVVSLIHRGAIAHTRLCLQVAQESGAYVSLPKRLLGPWRKANRPA